MTRPELDTKRLCACCGAKFFTTSTALRSPVSNAARSSNHCREFAVWLGARTGSNARRQVENSSLNADTASTDIASSTTIWRCYSWCSIGPRPLVPQHREENRLVVVLTYAAGRQPSVEVVADGAGS
jgi:hypothetical protein